jgi:putative sigma-54 modulation protein
MRVELTGRHTDINPALRRFVDRKLARLERMLNDAALSAQVVLTAEKHRRRADVTLHARGEKFLHGAGVAQTWPLALSLAIDRIAQQGKKVKGKWQERKRRGGRGAAAGGDQGAATVMRPAGTPRAPKPRMPQILRTTRQAISPMSVADAARQAVSNGEGVVIFRDVDTRAISVLYRRSDGELTLVETTISSP